MSFTFWKTQRSRMLSLAVGLALMPLAAAAHERFIKHSPKSPLYEAYFAYVPYTMLNIASRVAVLMALMIAVWFMREPLFRIVDKLIISKLPPMLSKYARLACDFAMDKPVDHPLFQTLGKWIVIFFVRCPALVLMFAAANKSLVMPSYPLEPSTTAFFQFAQVIMAIGILTQSFLPFGGATIFGTFIYMLMYYDWRIAVDVLPVLTVAVIYISSPWDSWNRTITTVTTKQMRWVRIVLGFGFFALGWMKLYNHYLTVGVADNYPSVLHDPMVKMFYFGTMPSLEREAWITAFGMAEIMTGFLVMVGIFSRVWCLMMVYVFTKLMVVDFGWEEIPHLYPIGAFMVVLFSNNLTNEFQTMDKASLKVAETKKGFFKHGILALVVGVLVSALVVYPALYALPFAQKRPIPNFSRSAEWHPNPAGTGGKLKIWFGPVPVVAMENAEVRFTINAKIKKQNGTILDETWRPEIASETKTVHRLNQPNLKTSDKETIFEIDIPDAVDIVSLTSSLTRVEDKKGDNEQTVGIPVEGVRGFKEQSLQWNEATPDKGTLRLLPLPRLGGEETKLTGKIEVRIEKYHEHKPDASTPDQHANAVREIEITEALSSSAPARDFELDLSGVTKDDGISIVGTFFHETDSNRYPMQRTFLTKPIKRSAAKE